MKQFHIRLTNDPEHAEWSFWVTIDLDAAGFFDDPEADPHLFCELYVIPAIEQIRNEVQNVKENAQCPK